MIVLFPADKIGKVGLAFDRHIRNISAGEWDKGGNTTFINNNDSVIGYIDSLNTVL